MKAVQAPGTAAYRSSTQKQLVLNHASKYCTGCKRRRSAGQFQSVEADYCTLCTRRGVDKQAAK